MTHVQKQVVSFMIQVASFVLQGCPTKNCEVEVERLSLGDISFNIQ